MTSNISKRAIALFLKSKTVESPRGCWEWQGRCHKGYPKVPRSVDRSRIGHRAMYAMCVGPIPCGLHILHTCDNRRCINPEHLYAGTNADNARDRVERRRARGGSMPNEKNPFCKFTDVQISEMRAAKASSRASNKLLAKQFQISESHLSHVLNGLVRRSNHLRP